MRLRSLAILAASISVQIALNAYADCNDMVEDGVGYQHLHHDCHGATGECRATLVTSTNFVFVWEGGGPPLAHVVDPGPSGCLLDQRENPMNCGQTVWPALEECQNIEPVHIDP